jgi:hypothetical protein
VPHNSPPAIQHGPIWGPGQGPEETLKPTHQSADPHLAVWGSPKSSSPHKLRLNSFLRQAHLHNICSLLRKTLCLGTSARCCEPVALLRLALPFSLSTHHDTQSCSGRCCHARLRDSNSKVVRATSRRTSPHPRSPAKASSLFRLTLPHHFSVGNHADLREDPHGQDYHP